MSGRGAFFLKRPHEYDACLLRGGFHDIGVNFGDLKTGDGRLLF